MCLPAISGSQKLRSRRTANPAIRVADVADRCGRATDMSTCIQLVGEESNSRTGGMGITVHLRWELVSKPTMRAAFHVACLRRPVPTVAVEAVAVCHWLTAPFPNFARCLPSRPWLAPAASCLSPEAWPHCHSMRGGSPELHLQAPTSCWTSTPPPSCPTGSMCCVGGE